MLSAWMIADARGQSTATSISRSHFILHFTLQPPIVQLTSTLRVGTLRPMPGEEGKIPDNRTPAQPLPRLGLNNVSAEQSGLGPEVGCFVGQQYGQIGGGKHLRDWDGWDTGDVRRNPRHLGDFTHLADTVPECGSDPSGM